MTSAGDPCTSVTPSPDCGSLLPPGGPAGLAPRGRPAGLTTAQPSVKIPALSLSLILLPLLAASCATKHSVAPPPATPAALPRVAPAAPAPPPASSPVAAPRVVQASLDGIALTLVAFDSRSHRLRVADQTGGPASRWPDSRAAGEALGGVAAINGGFFTPAGDPLGLVIADGRRAGTLNRSSLGSGIWFDDPQAGSALLRREQWQQTGPAHPRSLLQSGPFLVDQDRPVGGLENDRVRPRSVVAWDGGHRWFIATATPCTLDQLAATLARSQPAGWRIHRALNLDGGRSTELWLAAGLAGGPSLERPLWNKPVRNFLVLAPR